jgi:hypothetical protein
MMRAGPTSYAEAAYFDGAAVAHCAAWEENARQRRIACRFGRATRPSRLFAERVA